MEGILDMPPGSIYLNVGEYLGYFVVNILVIRLYIYGKESKAVFLEEICCRRVLSKI